MSYKVSCALPSLRKEWGLTQEELGQLIGNIGYQHISNLETGKAEPNMTLLFGVEMIFGVHPRDVFARWFDLVEEEIARCLYIFQQELGSDTSPLAVRKRRLVREAQSRIVLQGKQHPGYEL